MDYLEVLRSFLRENLRYLNDTFGKGPVPDFPEFDHYPRDYLQFAEEELQRQTPGSRIGCLANLKRALDCQAEIFLHVFGLRETMRRRGGGLPARLEFLERAEILDSRSPRRLNQLRNKVEQEYAALRTEDLELYCDHVGEVVRLLEHAVLNDTAWSSRWTARNTLSTWITRSASD